MKKTIKQLRFLDFPKGYRSLCNLHLPRPIHDKVDYSNSLEIIEAMAGFEEQFTRDQSDYFELLSDLVLAYEEERQKGSVEKALSFRDRLKFLLESAE